jgi:spermidine/putrescine ABC transporter ATP-binding subunit
MIAVVLGDLVKRFGSLAAVDHVSLDVLSGEFLTLLGPSGCGKTTTLRCIAGFVRPDTGRVRIADQDVTDMPPHRRNIGMVFQNYALFPHMTVLGNVAYALRIRGAPKEAIQAKVRAALELVRLTGLETRRVQQLSGGQQQRVALARALIYEPSVLLLDEPLSNLDAKLRAEMRVEIRNLQKRTAMTMVYVTHDQEEALAVSDRIAVMNAGHIEQVATPAEIYDRPQSQFVASFIGTSSILEGKIESDSGDGTTIRLPAGQQVRLPQRAGTEPGSPVSLIIRPEHVRLVSSAEGQGRATLLPGRIVATILLGPIMRLQIALPGDLRIAADLQRQSVDTIPREGDEVTVSILRAAIVPIGERGSA